MSNWKEFTNNPFDQRFIAECVAEEMQISYSNQIDILHEIFCRLSSDKCVEIVEDIARDMDCTEEMEEIIRNILEN